LSRAALLALSGFFCGIFVVAVLLQTCRCGFDKNGTESVRPFPFKSTTFVNMKHSRLRLVSYIVIAYMLMAFAWWSILLYTKNTDAYTAKDEMLRLRMASTAQFDGIDSEAYQLLEQNRADLQAEYEWQEWMILGESMVFIVMLIAGVYFIDQGYRKEVASAKQRRNFLLSITHELKSPIASIQLILETFLRRDLEPAAIKKFSGSALKETKRLHTLVSDLLLSAKLEKSFQLNVEEVDVSFLLNDLVTEIEEKHPNAHIHLSEKGDIPNIQGDLSGLTSVFINLLENAIKYSKDTPSIQVSIERVDEHIEIAIADEGIGIPDKEKKEVFSKFYRVGNEDTRSTKGTGLGLYIVCELVNMHGGSIQIRDNYPKGTVMSVCLPLAQPSKETTTMTAIQVSTK
jgi:signal transduction histidine kinase